MFFSCHLTCTFQALREDEALKMYSKEGVLLLVLVLLLFQFDHLGGELVADAMEHFYYASFILMA